MSNYLVDSSDLTSVANAIRTAGGTTAQLLFPSGFISAIQAISGGGGGGSGITEYETGTWTPTSNIARGNISFSNTHTAPPSIVVMADTTNDNNTTSNTNMVFMFVDIYRMFGSMLPYSSSTKRYSVISYIFRSTSSSSLSNGNTLCTYSSSNTGDSSDSYSRYWADASGFHPYSNSTTRFWRSGRTYKWFAVWLT